MNTEYLFKSWDELFANFLLELYFLEIIDLELSHTEKNQCLTIISFMILR